MLNALKLDEPKTNQFQTLWTSSEAEPAAEPATEAAPEAKESAEAPATAPATEEAPKA
jgi:14-3-3 protein epsilon